MDSMGVAVMADDEDEDGGEAGTERSRDRSPNYPALTFTDALAKAEVLWKQEKKSPMSKDIAAAHMKYASRKSGSFKTAISALKKYGLVEGRGEDVRVTEDAHRVFVYEPDAPERKQIIGKLAMKPTLFSEVLAKFPGGLPSDANLRSKLQIEWNFASVEASDTFIKALRDALKVASVDRPVEEGHSSGESDSQEEQEMPLDPSTDHGRSGQARGATPPPPAVPGQPSTNREQHAWKLGEGVWAQITITGDLTPKSFDRLKKYVDLIEVTEADDD